MQEHLQKVKLPVKKGAKSMPPPVSDGLTIHTNNNNSTPNTKK